MITWNDLSVGELEALQAIQFRKVVNVFADAMRLAGMELIKVDTENPTTFLLLTDAGRAVLAQKPANDSGAAVHPASLMALHLELGNKHQALELSHERLQTAHEALQAENARLQRELEAALSSTADYQQAIRNLRETVAALKSEMHEVAYSLANGDVSPQDAAKRLESALNG